MKTHSSDESGGVPTPVYRRNSHGIRRPFQQQDRHRHGAGSGIGRATSVRLAAEGAHVVATDVVEARLTALAAELGDTVSTVTGDIADSTVIDQILDATKGKVDGLANVAGIMDGFLPTAEIDDETWDRVLAVNLTGMMRLTRAVRQQFHRWPRRNNSPQQSLGC